jgi:hypothetical protein
MGLFSGQSTAVEDIQTGFNVPAGEYEFQITDVTLKHFDSDHAKMANQSALIIELTVVNACPQEGMTFDVFLTLPNEEEQTEKRARQCASFLKNTLTWFGIPESRLDSWDPETEADAILDQRGLGVLKTSKTNSDFTNLTSFQLTEESGASDTSVSATAGADLSSWAS